MNTVGIVPTVGSSTPWGGFEVFKNKRCIKLNGGHFTGAKCMLLTTNHPASSYGIPVLVLLGGPHDGMAFGAADRLPSADPADPLAWIGEPAYTSWCAASIAERRLSEIRTKVAA